MSFLPDVFGESRKKNEKICPALPPLAFLVGGLLIATRSRGFDFSIGYREGFQDVEVQEFRDELLRGSSVTQEKSSS